MYMQTLLGLYKTDLWYILLTYKTPALGYAPLVVVAKRSGEGGITSTKRFFFLVCCVGWAFIVGYYFHFIYLFIFIFFHH